MDKTEDVEEERRLFYVGMTRARKKLYLSYASMRRRMGVIEGGSPSRFLFEVPDECLEGSLETEDRGLFGDADFEDIAPPASVGAGSMRPPRPVGKEFEDYSQEEVYYSVGTKIVHKDFGRGIVRKVEGTGEDLRVTVLFDSGSERKFIAQYAPMRPA